MSIKIIIEMILSLFHIIYFIIFLIWLLAPSSWELFKFFDNYSIYYYIGIWTFAYLLIYSKYLGYRLKKNRKPINKR